MMRDSSPGFECLIKVVVQSQWVGEGPELGLKLLAYGYFVS